MMDNDNWLTAKHELTYRIKEKTNELGKKSGLTAEQFVTRAEQKIRQDIELRAYLVYQATRDHALDNWLQGERECSQMIDFSPEVNSFAQELCQALGSWLDLQAARELAKIEFKIKAAYYIWKKRCRAEYDWYSSEKSLSNEIEALAQAIVKDKPYLSKKEARYCAKDRLFFKIKERAYHRRRTIAEQAYCLTKSNPNNTEYENWCLSAKNYDNPESFDKNCHKAEDFREDHIVR